MKHCCGNLRTGGILPLGLAYCYGRTTGYCTVRRSCNRPNPTNIALLFVRARANPELVHTFHVALRTPNIPLKFLPCVVLVVLSNFSHNTAPPVRRQIRPGSHLPSIAASSLPIILPSAIFNSLHCFQANFTSRTIGYCLRKLRVIKKISP